MEVTRTFDILDRCKANFIKDDLLASKQDGVWKKVGTLQYIGEVNNFSFGMLANGFKRGDRIATVSNNRPEWNIVDMGMAQAGVVHIPIYPTISDEEYEHILEHSGVKLLFVSDKELYERLKVFVDKIPGLEEIYTFNKIEGAKHWSEIQDAGKQNAEKYTEELQSIKDSIKPDDLVSIIYTSGTTGVPKGVMLSHNNFISNTKAAAKNDILPLGPAHRALSFLPLCHVYERMVNYGYQYLGISVYYAESMDTIGDNLKEVKPHCFVSVPRLLEKVYDKIINRGKDLSFIKRSLFFWAVNLGLKYKLNRENGWWYECQLKYANKLIFSKWREALGGNVVTIISGGAALQPRLARVFWAAGIRVQEGYGLTETSPVIAVNRNEYPDTRFGTVGPLIEDVEVKIAEDGEILCKGPNIMLGYYKDQEKTREVIDEDGWFHTGDIGVIEDNKFLKITDRKKEMFKTSGGKYVAPQVIENILKESLFIDQIMIVGENRKFVSALISPNFEFLHDYCALKGIKFNDNQSLIEKQVIIDRYGREVDKYNERLGHVEKIKKFALVPDQWIPQTKELSPTLKLKRRFLKEKYKNLIEKIYSE